ncbi:MAG: hypothetical protein KFH98_08220 [Gemmatimonadetes bacterium]|nr:hypothetical protein [Gemmatimonadota bacterium]
MRHCQSLRVLLLPLLLLFPAMQAQAQARENAPLLLQLPASTRAAALGDAYHLASADNDAIFYHPGLIDAARGMGGSLAFFEYATLATLSAAAEFWGGGVAFGVQSLSWSAPTRASGAFSRGEAGLGESGGVNASELAVSAGYGRVIKGFRVGVAATYIEMRVPGERDVTVAGDIGIARRIGFVTAGFSARNLGRSPALEGEDLALPRTLTLGASTQTRAVGPLDMSAAAAVSHREDGTFIPHAGIEVAYWPVSGRTFTGRVGVRYIDDSDIRPLTLGAGFTGDRIGIDYGFQGYEEAGVVHRVGVRVR